MKIGFDGKRAVCNNTGLGNYSRLLVKVLSNHYPDLEYALYTPEKRDNPRLMPLLTRQGVSVATPDKPLWKAVPALWRVAAMARQMARDGVDIIHGLSGELPFDLAASRLPSVVTVHDLIFRRCPECYKPADRKIYDYKVRKAAGQATRVLAISQCTKRDLISDYGISEDKIDVVYQGCDPIFGQAVQEDVKSSVREKYQINGPYILYVGSIEERKNLLLLVKALKALKEDISVIAIGKHTPYTDTVETYIRENNLSGRVRILTHIPFNELAAFYQMATLFVYPSFFEGFGIPILEAQLAGIPVIAATGSCLEEAGGSSALYTDPRNEQELRGLIESVLNEPKLAESMRSGGRENIRRFMPDVLAAHFMRVYENISRS